MINTAKKSLILAVDDELRNLLLIEAMLVPLGYDVIFAHDGAEALEKVAEVSPDVVLLDVMMPKIDGFEVVRQIKANQTTRIIPVVMVTALNDVNDRVKALDAGADDFLNKPVDKTELRARVKSLVYVKTCNDYMRNYQRELELKVAQRTKELQLALSEIKKASLDAIYMLSVAAEFKDCDTGVHIKRMSLYATAIAKKMGVDDHVSEMILYAAPMHDVGKIGVPDRILMKPARLDPDEWEVMKLHSSMGGKILEGSTADFIKLARSIALTHHEKWDGTGYPAGLKEREIPLAGRIVALADVFDALTSKRPYKDAFDDATAIKIIRQNSGLQFDPVVVDAFLAIESEILSIREKYREGAISPVLANDIEVINISQKQETV